jgi:hypothetical protein
MGRGLPLTPPSLGNNFSGRQIAKQVIEAGRADRNEAARSAFRAWSQK